MKKGVVICLILFLILVSSVFAAQFGRGRYNIGSYGLGEEDSGGPSGGSGTAAKTSGGSIIGSGSSFSLQTPDGLEDGVFSASDFNCANTCTVKVKEIAQAGLPSSISVSFEGIFLGAIQLECTNGNLETGATTFTINAQEGLSCDNIKVDKLKDDGTQDEVNFQCSSSDSTLTVTATYSGCSYLIVSKSQTEQQQEVAPQVEEKKPQEQQPLPPTTIAPPEVIGKGGMIGLILGLVVLLILGFAVYIMNKKKKILQSSAPVAQPTYQAYKPQSYQQPQVYGSQPTNYAANQPVSPGKV